MDRVKEIIDIIFSLPEEERKEVERRIKERKEKTRGLKLKVSENPWADNYKTAYTMEEDTVRSKARSLGKKKRWEEVLFP